MSVVLGIEEMAMLDYELVEDEKPKINTNKTRLSFPPLYERDNCSGLYHL